MLWTLHKGEFIGVTEIFSKSSELGVDFQPVGNLKQNFRVVNTKFLCEKQ